MTTTTTILIIIVIIIIVVVVVVVVVVLFQLPALPPLSDGHNVDIMSGGHDIPEAQNGTSKPLDASLHKRCRMMEMALM